MDTELVDRVADGLTTVDGGDRFHVTIDRPVIEPSVAIVAAVAAVTDRSPTAIDPPLSTIVDADAVDRLFAHRTDVDSEDHVVFYVQGCRVELYADDHIEIVPPT